MAEPVNLNRFRKDQARAEKKARANQNAVKFGRNKAEKQLDRSRLENAKRDLDGHQNEP
ncbi:DUF4169 family protein [Parasedimentitalea psychrophila]|uniref:DUF4169 family protein n=1 Tax=Parasedimentitalea psychrophila TaxID=2997337 RepID=A0A9Y2P028_9RHOB|nr:DUF4169 family protein [Parasedimentitalea psychrophila]WIY24181.1 DUF4169 family protein [Parasedimentitalea psychrophila]